MDLATTIEALKDAMEAITYATRLFEILLRDGMPSNANMNWELTCAEAQLDLGEFIERVKEKSERKLCVVKEQTHEPCGHD